MFIKKIFKRKHGVKKYLSSLSKKKEKEKYLSRGKKEINKACVYLFLQFGKNNDIYYNNSFFFTLYMITSYVVII